MNTHVKIPMFLILEHSVFSAYTLSRYSLAPMTSMPKAFSTYRLARERR